MVTTLIRTRSVRVIFLRFRLPPGRGLTFSVVRLFRRAMGSTNNNKIFHLGIRSGTVVKGSGQAIRTGRDRRLYFNVTRVGLRYHGFFFGLTYM